MGSASIPISGSESSPIAISVPETGAFGQWSSGRGRAQGQSRTVYTRIFSPLLYQLSYLGPAFADGTYAI